MLSFYSGAPGYAAPLGPVGAYRRFTYAGSIAAIRGLAARVCPACWRQNPPRLHPSWRTTALPGPDRSSVLYACVSPCSYAPVYGCIAAVIL